MSDKFDIQIDWKWSWPGLLRLNPIKWIVTYSIANCVVTTVYNIKAEAQTLYDKLKKENGI